MLPTIDIKGKEYVLVKDRILFFNETYKNGSIVTEYTEDEKRISFKAIVTPNVDKPERKFVGHSQAVWGDGYINKTSALENAETSAVGRALAFMGIGIVDSIASADEVNKAMTPEARDFLPDDPTKKQCPVCKKWHNGQYPKCIDCWKKKV